MIFKLRLNYNPLDDVEKEEFYFDNWGELLSFLETVMKHTRCNNTYLIEELTNDE